MNKKQLQWQMMAEQFAAFDMRLYLDTHPHDKAALKMYDAYNMNYLRLKKEYESLCGPLSAANTSSGKWDWVKDPWPWEKEAN